MLKPSTAPGISVNFPKLSLGLLRKVAALKEWKYRGREKATAFETDVVRAGATSVVRQKQAARHVHLKLVLGAAHGDVDPRFRTELFGEAQNVGMVAARNE